MIKRNRSRSQWLYVVWGGILVVIIVVGVLLITQRKSSKVEVETSAESEVISTEGEQDLKDQEEDQDGTESEMLEETTKEEIIQYDGGDPNTEEELSGVITYAEVSNEELKIRVNIDQYLETGSCTLKLKQNGTTIYWDTVNVVSAVSTATCEGFDVPTAELATGSLQIEISIMADNKTGMIVGEVSL